MSNNELVLKGQACIQAAKNAYDLITTHKNTKKAIRYLSALKEDGKLLQRVAEENKEKSVVKEQELEKELDSLTRQKHSHELTVSQLSSEKRDQEYKLQQQRQKLSNARQDLSDAQTLLSDAESKLREAKDKKLKVGLTSAAVGLFTGGPIGLAAGVAVGAVLISKIEDKCRDARKTIRDKEDDIWRAERDIRSSNHCLSDVQHKISDCSEQILRNERGAMRLHNKITENKETLATEREALRLWELFMQASETATGRTERLEQRLEQIVQIANTEKKLKIIRSDGTLTVANSVMEAWQEISLMQGQITFH